MKKQIHEMIKLALSNKAPVLKKIRVYLENGRCRLSATDRDIELALWVPCDILGDPQSKFLIDATQLKAAVASSKREPAFIIKTDAVVVNSITLSIDTAGYYLKPTLLYNKKFETTTLLPTLRTIAYAMGKRDVRPFLNGALFQFVGSEIHITASDGNRAATTVKSTKLPGATQAIIPNTAVNLALKVFDIEKPLFGALYDNCFVFQQENTHLITKLIDAKYPEIAKVFGQTFSEPITVPIAPVLTALKVLKAFSKSVRVTIDASTLRLATPENDQEFKIPVVYAGKHIEIGFHTPHLIDLFTHLSESTSITIADNASCLVVTDGDIHHVTMALRL